MSLMPIELGRENDPDYEYIPDPMGRLGQGTWRRRRKFDSFGRILPDPTFETFRAGFDLTKPIGRIFRDRTPDLVAPVGREGENERFDVALIETLLAKTGFFDLVQTEGPTGYYGMALEDAIRKFQKTEKLKVDGLVNPGGPTLAALATRLAAAEGANESRDEVTDKDPDTGDGRKPINLLEAAMQGGSREFPWKRRDIPGDGGGGAGVPRWPVPPPILPSRKTDTPESGRQPPAEDDPDADQARREDVAEDFVNDITAPLESHRGDETTRKGNDIVAHECREVLKEGYPDLANKIKHIGGATEDGVENDDDKLPEKFVPNKELDGRDLDARRGSSHPDLTWQDKDKDDKDPRAFAHANTATMDKKGNPTTREESSYERLVKNVGEEFATQLPKLRPGMDEDDYRAAVREKCREIFDKWLGKPRKDASDDAGEGTSAP